MFEIKKFIAVLTLVATVWIRWGATLLVVVATALTAADRIVLGVHYVSDVAAGLVLGSALALVGLRCFPLRPAADPPPADSTSP